jgi:hypothetical protein
MRNADSNCCHARLFRQRPARRSHAGAAAAGLRAVSDLIGGRVRHLVFYHTCAPFRRSLIFGRRIGALGARCSPQRGLWGFGCEACARSATL